MDDSGRGSATFFALDRARLAAGKWLSHEGEPTIARDPDERKRRLAFLEGSISEVDLLAAPSRGSSDLCVRHYYVAWKRLGEGDRDGARKEFEEAYSFKLADYHAWRISRMVLIRMKDPSWPPAIPRK
jgi:hypothetical protein